MSDAVPSQYCLVLIARTETSQSLYSLEAAAELTGVPAELIHHYCRIGLLGDERQGADLQPVFDDDTLFEVRRIENLRQHHGVNLRALPLVCRLARDIEQLQGELRFLRDRLG